MHTHKMTMANVSALCNTVRFDRSQVQADPLSAVEEVLSCGQGKTRQFNYNAETCWGAVEARCARPARREHGKSYTEGSPCRGALNTPSLCFVWFGEFRLPFSLAWPCLFNLLIHSLIFFFMVPMSKKAFVK